MADEMKQSADTTLACFHGYADCVEGAMEKDGIIGSGVYESGKVRIPLGWSGPIRWAKRIKGNLVV